MENEAYVSRCDKALKAIGAPLEGWSCINVVDHENETNVCELCGCSKVRYMHIMHHEDFYENLSVGCVCAGVMEGDMLAAKNRERVMKNRARRKQHFPYWRRWKSTSTGNYLLKYHGLLIFINVQSYNQYTVCCNDRHVYQYKGKPIDSFKYAAYAAFDLAEEELNAGEGN
jgi:hypothetical protein